MDAVRIEAIREYGIDKLISELEKLGCTRWTKYGKDRIYFNRRALKAIGYDWQPHNNGRGIGNATLNGEEISIHRIDKVITDIEYTYLDLMTLEIGSRIDLKEDGTEDVPVKILKYIMEEK